MKFNIFRQTIEQAYRTMDFYRDKIKCGMMSSQTADVVSAAFVAGYDRGVQDMVERFEAAAGKAAT